MVTGEKQREIALKSGAASEQATSSSLSQHSSSSLFSPSVISLANCKRKRRRRKSSLLTHAHIEHFEQQLQVEAISTIVYQRDEAKLRVAIEPVSGNSTYGEF